jgi:uncharacterized protein
MLYPWGHNRRFNAYPDYMRKTFGSRVQKLTIDAGFSCPNRDGTKGTGGCTFCLNDAFNPSYCQPDKPVVQQIREGITFHEKRYRRATKYLAYFQAFSNTHAPVEVLEQRFRDALNVDGVVGLVIGTRPDCMDDQKLDLLQELSVNCHVMVEYGIESVYNKTLNRVNRCHTFEEAVDAIERTSLRGISVGSHLIFGLPGESLAEMMRSATIISQLPLTSVKFHQLQLFKGTRMAEEYLACQEDFIEFNMQDYIEFMADYIELLNPALVVERIAGETPPRFAVHSPWGPRYDQILMQFENLLEERNTWQGKLWNGRTKT